MGPARVARLYDLVGFSFCECHLHFIRGQRLQYLLGWDLFIFGRRCFVSGRM